ncbi:MAG: ribonuclease HII [Zoogloeaceae bacterium]|jgi:ribonuclease HII|nr:ribonuclease HII [Zoogloeaceae bacterium]
MPKEKRVLDALPPDVCGIDEAGRGALVGAVVAAAVILDPARPIEGLDDSKRLSPARREALAAEIRKHALAFSLGEASAAEVDAFNILRATFLAMCRAVEALPVRPVRAVVDGNRAPPLALPVSCVVKGDGKIAAVAAASILAKTARDERMRALHARRPEYGFDRHMGYPTAAHLAALERFGPCAAHRESFAPVRKIMRAITPREECSSEARQIVLFAETERT